MKNNFENIKLNQSIVEILLKNNFKELNEVQRNVIPMLKQKKDTIVQSPTGTGKTLSFLIPIAEYIKLNWNNNNICAVILAPTRELSLQIKEVSSMFNEIIKCECFIGGCDITVDKEVFETKNFNLVVATPGRFLELLIVYKKRFSQIEFLILDEADKLISLGFYVTLTNILSNIPKQRITGLFSATIDDSVNRISKLCLRNPVNVKLDSKDLIPANLKLEYILVKAVDKLKCVLSIIKNNKSIVFFVTCAQVEFFYDLFVKMKIENIHKIHGKMPQNERNVVYKEYEQKDSATLLCTDLAARGIDFKNINRVIHFDLPTDPANLIHRSGRTARNGNKGDGLIFIMENEKSYIDYLKVKKIDAVEFKEFQLDAECKDLKNLVTDELLKKSIVAFVSFIRAYKEHCLSYILNYKELDLDSIVELHFLEKIPKMKELRDFKFKKFDKIKDTNLKKKFKRKVKK